MSEETLYPRFLNPRIMKALVDSPLVLFHGPRQCGKTTLTRLVGVEASFAYFTFDDDVQRAAAKTDPVGYVADLPEQAVLDEVQRVPKLLTSLKAAVDTRRKPGRFILTGSVNVLLVTKLADSLAGRMEILRLHPLSQAELGGKPCGFLGEAIQDQHGATVFSPRCNKDLVEELIFTHRRDLFSNLDLVFFDTTSIYFEGRGGESIGQRGFSKDHRPDLVQMVVGAVLDDKGQPICCEMWPGNTADVKTLLPIVDRLKTRFKIARICIVADRGMISADTLKQLESEDSSIPYILGARMRKVKQIRDRVLSQPGRYKLVRPESSDRNKPAPLKVKQVEIDGCRYIVCVNTRQQRKDAADRQAIVSALTEQLKKGPKSLVGNKGFRKYVKIEKGSTSIDEKRIKDDARFDGKWVLRTNTDLSADQVALKYKQLWQVEKVFRDVKSLLTTRPIFHQKDRTIRGHVFCSFLALVLRKELDRRLSKAGHRFEWAEIKQDLKALQRVTIEEDGRHLSIRSQSKGVCGKIFQAVGVAMPPTIQPVRTEPEILKGSAKNIAASCNIL